MAEAVQRGYITVDLATLYNAGVRAYMDQMAIYDVSATIASSTQSNYLISNPYNPATALSQINTQY